MMKKTKISQIVAPTLFLSFLFANCYLPVVKAAPSEVITFDGLSASSSLTIVNDSSLVSSPELLQPQPVSEPVIIAPEKFSINLDKETIAKGYTVAPFDGALKLSLVPGILSESTRVDSEILNENIASPWRFDRLSKIYQFEFRNKAAYDNHKPFYIQLSYDSANAGLKKVFFYDKNANGWRELPTVDFPNEKFVRSLIHLPYARIAVFTDNSIMASGQASWYAYKGGDFAASPDFPKGSKLRVTNIGNGKYVDIIVNDYGPDRRLHPDRAIDLDKVAFSKISSVGAGLIDIKIEPLAVKPDVRGLVLGVSPGGKAAFLPETTSRALTIYNETTGEFIYEKNSTSSLSIASLTKLVAVKIFFDQHPTLSQVVEYKKQDEDYNALYSEPWRNSKLTVKEGETMTIEDLVYSSLVGSANNAVESLVRVSGLSRENFIKAMNDFAVSVGATGTKFVEPTGLAFQNVSTARDYAIMIKEVFKNPIIQKISTTPKYTFLTINTKKPHTLYNTNSFLREGLFALEKKLQITGSKTGYLDESLYCLMTRVSGPNGEKLTVVNLGASNGTNSTEEVKELINYGIKKID
jgi:D-alanyl-D-alanine endopeptidase (penicillin-binding protein 7)